MSTTPIATTLATADKWATVGLPKNFDVENYLHWEVNWPQFEAIQSQCSGARFASDFEDSVKFILDRDEDLHQDALRYEDDYDLPMGHCPFGWLELESHIHLWYETTSGTVLVQTMGPEGQKWEVFLPKSREGGYHWKEIQYALAGRTRAMAQRWHNSYMFLDDPDYFQKRLEEVEWHNSHMVGIEGFEPLEHPAQEKLRRKMERVFRRITQPDDLDSAITLANSILHGREEYRPDNAQKVLSALKGAVRAWEELMEAEGWSGGTDPDDLPDYEGKIFAPDAPGHRAPADYDTVKTVPGANIFLASPRHGQGFLC